MRTTRLTLALGVATLLLASRLFATPPTQVAKLPVAPTPAAPKAPPVGARSSGRPTVLAQLAYPVPTTSSAAELLRAADDYAFYADWDHYRQYLYQIASAYPGTKEAGRALALLAENVAAKGDQAQAAALSAQLADADPETQAFAALVHTVDPAEEAKQFQVAEQAYLAYLQVWKGTPSADWAALRLGDLYRFKLDDFSKALATFQGLAQEYQTGPLAEEALVSIAESLNWSETGRNAEARTYYEQALAVAQNPGLQVRALYGLGDMLMVEGELSASADTFTQIITAYPTHPSAALAYALRSQVAERRGDWELTVSDVKAYLTYPSASMFQTARAHWILAKDAFRGHRLDVAEAEFTLLAQLADTSRHTVEFRGEAQSGLAYCALARGQLRDAMQLFQRAADVAYYPQKKAVYLFTAAGLAKQLGDDAVRNAIIARMTQELPGSFLTTKLVGHEILPSPNI